MKTLILASKVKHKRTLSQKMAMRAITFSPFRTPSNPLFKKLGVMDVFELHKLSICTFIFDLSKGNLPHDLVEYCQNIQHSYSTRGKKEGLLYLPKCKTLYGQLSISYMGVKLWNTVPKNIRKVNTRKSFRTKLAKTHFICIDKVLHVDNVNHFDI